MKLRRIDSELVRCAQSRATAAQMIEMGASPMDRSCSSPLARCNPAQAIVVEESDDPEYVSRGAHACGSNFEAYDKAPLEGRRL